MDTEQVVVVTKEKYDEAMLAEAMHLMTAPDFQEKPGGAMMLAMSGVAFAKKVWMRLMGEIKEEG